MGKIKKTLLVAISLVLLFGNGTIDIVVKAMNANNEESSVNTTEDASSENSADSEEVNETEDEITEESIEDEVIDEETEAVDETQENLEPQSRNSRAFSMSDDGYANSFDLNDWYSTKDHANKTIILKAYKPPVSDKEKYNNIYIPSKHTYNGETWLVNIDSMMNGDPSGLLSSTNVLGNMKGFSEVETFRIEAIDGRKVQLERPSMYQAFPFYWQAWNGYRSNARKLDLNGLDTSNVTNFKWTFLGLVSLEELIIDEWDTSSGTEFTGMFANMKLPAGKGLDLNGWNLASATRFSGTFQRLEMDYIDVNNWKLPNATDLNELFQGAKVRAIYAQEWEIPKVETLYAFAPDSTVEELDIRNWKAPKINSITSGDPSNYAFAKTDNLMLINMNGWAAGVPNLTSVNQGAFATPAESQLTIVTDLPALQEDKYDYKKDNRKPAIGPQLFAGEGYFAPDKNDKLRFVMEQDKIVFAEEKYVMPTPEEFNEVFYVDVPVFDGAGYRLRRWNPHIVAQSPYTSLYKDTTTYESLFSDNYYISYNTEGGDEMIFQNEDGDTVNYDMIKYMTKATPPVQIPEKEGFEFVGWYEKNEAGELKEQPFDYENTLIDKDFELYAKWERNTYTATFHATDGEFAEGAKTMTKDVLYESTFTAPVEFDAPKLDGHSVEGWYTSSTFEAATKWDFTTDGMPIGGVDLYAKWEIGKYTVRFKHDENEIFNPYFEVPYNGFIANPGSVPEITGYHFIGWYQTNDFSGEAWNFATSRVKTDMVLYAKYSPNEYTITFVTDPIEETDTQDFTKPGFHDAPIAKPTEEMVRKGYEFVDWYEDEDFTILYDFNKVITGEMSLYAKWSINTYIVTFDTGVSGINVPEQPVIYKNLVNQPTNPIREGYEFDTWYSDSARTEEWNFETPVEGNMTLYGTWTPNKYTATFYEDFEDLGKKTTADIYYDGKITKPATPDKEGHTFDGKWYTDAARTQEWDFENEVVTGDVTLYAGWTINNYSLIYVVDQTSEQPISIEFRSALTQIADPVKYGYDFNGWSEDLTEDPVVHWDFASTNMPAHNVTLYADFQKKSYNITFDLQGGVITPDADPQDVLFEEKIKAPENDPTREGYEFSGWYLTPEDVDPSTPDSPWDFENDVVKGEMSLFARWEKDIYSVNFVTNQPDWTVDAQRIPYMNLVDTTKIPAYSKEGWTFGGWYTTPQFEDVNKWDLESDKVEGPMTLYAKWTINTHEVTFITTPPTGEADIIKTENVDFDAFLPKPDLINYSTYKFLGWTQDAAGNGPTWRFEIDKMPDSPMTLYAQYAPYELSAHSAVIASSEVNASLDEQKVLDLVGASVSVKGTTTTNGISASFSIQPEPKEYAVVLTLDDDQAVTKTVNITVKDQVKTDGQYRISANNFEVNLADVEELKDLDKLKVMAQLEAVKITDGVETPAEVITEGAAIPALAGTYPVTFKIKKEESVAVTINVRVNDKENTDGTYNISASNFYLSSKEVEDGLTSELLIRRANAKALEIKTNKNKKVEVQDFTHIQTAPGTYNVVFNVEGEALSVTVTATVVGDLVISDDYILTANDFYVKTKEVKDLDKNKIIEATSATLVDRKTGETVNDKLKVDHSAVIAKPGKYNVNFTVKDSTENIKVVANVSDHFEESNDYILTANDFSIPKNDVDAQIETKVVELAKATVYNKKTGVTTSAKAITPLSILPIPNDYSVSFKAEDDTSEFKITVIATVTDKGFEDSNYKLNANDFTITTQQAQNLSDIDIIDFAGATAIDKSTNKKADINVVENKIRKTAGNYTVGFEVDGYPAAKIVVNATVQDKVVEKGDYLLSASDFELSVADAINIPDSDITTRGKVVAINKHTGEPQTVKYSHGIMGKVGEYTVDIKITGIPETIETTITATVKDKVVIFDEYRLSANNFDVKIADFDNLKDGDIITNANATALNLVTNQNDDMIVLDRTKLIKQPGIYPVRLAVEGKEANEIGIFINVVTDKNENNAYSIKASDFSVKTVDVADLSHENILNLAQVVAIDKTTNKPLLSTDIEQVGVIGKTAGKYEVIFRVKADTDVFAKITVTVTDKQVTSGDVRLEASDFYIAKKDIRTLLPQTIIEKSNAHAYNTKTGLPVEVTIDEASSQNIIAKPGEYTIGLVANDGTNVAATTIDVIVRDNVVEIDDYLLSANDFEIKKTLVDQLDSNAIKTRANFKILNKITGETDETVLVSEEIEALAGSYDVKFELESNTNVSLTTLAIVTDESMSNDFYSISGNDFNLRTDEVNAIKNDKDALAARANLEVLDLQDDSVAEFLMTENDLRPTPGNYQVKFVVENDPDLFVVIDIKVFDQIVEFEDVVVTANNFMIDTTKARTINNSEAKRLSKASAYNKNTGAPVDVTVTQNILPIPDTYDVTVSVEVNGQNKSLIVLADVRDEINTFENYQMSANDLSFKKEDVTPELTDEIAMLANVKAIDLRTGKTAEIEKVSGRVYPRKGTYTFIYKVRGDESAKISLSVNVYDNIFNDGNYRLKANNFVLTVDEAIALNNDADEIIRLSGAKATEIASGKNESVRVKGGEIQPTPNDYTITLGLKNTSAEAQAVELPITVTVVDKTVTKNDYRLTANDFTVKKSDLENLNIVDAAKAKAENIKTGAPGTVKVKDDAKVPNITGTHAITLFVDEEQDAKLTISVKVVDNYVEEHGYRLEASDFTVKASDVEELKKNNALLVTKAKAKATIIETGKTNLPITADASELKAVPNTYEVVYSIDEKSEVKIAVKVTVVDHLVDNGTYQLSANDFEVLLADVENLSNDEIIIKSGAKGLNLLTGNPETPFVMSGKVEKRTGVYTITLALVGHEDIAVPIKVTVSDKTEEGTNFILYASNFAVQTSKVKDLDEAAIIKLAKAKSVNKATNKDGKLKVISAPIRRTSGVQDVTFESVEEPGLTITVQVTVSDQIETIDGIVISGSNFTIKSSEVKNLDDEKVRILTNANAYEEATGTTRTVDVDYSAVSETPGDYNVELAVNGTGASITVKAFVRNHVETDEDYAISANDFTIKVDEVATMDLKQRAGIVATDLTTGLATPFEVVGETVKPVAGMQTVEVAVVAQPSVFVRINVNVTENSESDGVYTITASSFRTTVDQVGTLKENPNLMVGLANASAIDDTTKQGVDVEVQSETLRKTAGTYDVTFVVKDLTTPIITVKVYVDDVSETFDDIVLSGSNFTITTAQADGITEGDIRGYAKANAYNKTNGESVAIGVKHHILPKEGDYEVTLYAGGDEAKAIKVTATVRDKVKETDKYRIAANDFTITVADVENLDTDKIQDLASVVATNLETGEVLEKDAIEVLGTIHPIKGTTTITFTVKGDPLATVDVIATVTDHATTKDNYTLYANDFAIRKADVNAALTNEVIINLAQAHATNNATGKGADVEVESGDIKATPGTYPVVFRVKDAPQVTQEILVTVTDKSIEKDGYILSANDITLETTEVADYKADLNKIVTKAEAKAVQTLTGEKGTVKVDSTTLEATPGTYQATLYVDEKDTVKLTIQITVVDKAITQDGYEITANHMIINKSAYNDYLQDPQKYVVAAEAKAKNTVTGETGLAILVDASQVKPVVGTYDVTFKVSEKDSVAVTVQVEIVDDFVEEGNYRLSANHITITKAEAIELKKDDEKLIKAMSAKAVNTKTGQPGKVLIDDSKLEAYPGTYNVTFKVNEEPNAKLTMKVVVSDDAIEKDGHRLEASNFVVKTSEVESLATDSDALISLAKAVGTNLETGETPLDLEVDATAMKARKGNYDVIFTIKDAPTVSITVQATVVDHVDVNEYQLTANNVELLVSEVATTNILTASGAQAVNLTTGEDGTPFIKSGTVPAKVGTYSVVLSVQEDPAVEVTITVRVTDKTVEGTNFILSASNFAITTQEAKTLSNDDIILKSNAKAVSKTTSETSEVVVKSGKVKHTPGVYTLTLEAVKEPGLTTEIDVTVSDQIETIDGIVISGSNFTIKSSEVKNLDDEKVRTLTNANAYEEATGATRTVDVDYSAVSETPGDYNVELAVNGTGASITVKAFVRNHVETDEDYAISANDFTIKVDEVATMNLEQRAGIVATDLATGLATPFEVVGETVKPVAGMQTVEVAVVAQPSVFVRINVNVTENSESDGVHTITASSFRTTVDQVGTLKENPNLMVGLANASAIDDTTKQGVDVEVQSETLRKTAGTYDVTFVVKDLTTPTITVKVYVDDESETFDDIVLSGSNFTITTAQADGITEGDIRGYAKANAYNKTNGESVAIGVKHHILPKEGDYEVTLYAGGDEAKAIKVTATVRDKVKETDKYRIAANDFTITVADVENLDTDKIQDLASVVATNLETGEVLEKDAIEVLGTIHPIKGTTTITFTVKGDPLATVDVIATVTDHATTKDNYTLYANDFAIRKADVNAALTNEVIINLAQAHATNNATGKGADVEVESGDIKATPGTYPVVFRVKDAPQVTQEILVTVTDKSIEKDGYILSANDITLETTEVADYKADLNKIVTKAEAKAVQTLTGEKGTVKVDSTTLEATPGTYQATLYVDEKDTVKLTIQITVVDKAITQDGYEITANHMVINKSAYNDYLQDPQKYVVAAEAKAKNTVTGETGLAILVDASQVKPVVGTYDVTFKVSEKDSVAVTVQVEIVDDFVEEGNYRLSANHITVTKAEAIELKKDDEKLIKAMNAKAVNTKTGQPGKVLVDDSKLEAYPGTYNVTFKVNEEPNAKLTMKVVVSDDAIEKDGHRLEASNFVVKTSEVESLATDSDALISLAKAVGTNLETGETPLDLEVDATAMKARKGNYDVIFTIKDAPTVSITVQATVVDHVDVNEYQLTANNVELLVSEVATTNILTASSAQAVNLTTGKAGTPFIKSGTVPAKVGTYSVVLSVQEDPAVEVTITVRVTDKTVEGTNFILSASNFAITTQEAKTLSNDDIILKSNAKAVSKTTSETSEVVVKSGKVKHTPGVYTLTLEAVKEPGLTTEIDVTVSDQIETIDGIVISGSNFTIKSSEVTSLDDEKVRILTNANAYEEATGTTRTVDVDYSAVSETPGDYNVELAVNGTGASITVKAFVRNHVETDEDYAISANDFTIKVDEVATMDLKQRAGIVATDLTTGLATPFEVVGETVKPVAGMQTVEVAVVAQPSVFVRINVNVTENSESDGVHTITASSFRTTVDQVGTLKENPNLMVGLANASAIDDTTKQGVDVEVQSETLRKTAGTYDVTFVVKDLTTPTITVKVYVDDVSETFDDIVLSGSNFTITTAQADGITEGNIRGYAKANAYNKTNGEPVAIGVKHHILPKEGDYEVTLYAGGDEAKAIKVTATVRDKVKETDKYIISGNNFKTTVKKVKAGINIEQEANISATNLETGASATVEMVEDTVKPIKGTYVVRFRVVDDHAAFVDISVTVVDQSIEKNGYEISANNFTVKTSEVKELIKDNNKLILAADAKAKTIVDGKLTDVIHISNTIQPVKGTYEAIFAVKADENVQIKVVVTVVDTSISNDTYEITANNFNLLTKDVSAIIGDDDELIKKANAKATNLKTGEAGTVRVVSTNLEAVAGTYQVVFGITQDNTIELPVVVTVTDTSKENDQYHLTANDFEVLATDVATLDDDKIIELAGAKGTNKHTGKDEKVIVIEDNIRPTAGTYKVIFGLDNASDLKVTISVTVSDSVEQIGDIVVKGNNFFLTTKEAKSPTAEFIRKKADAQAYNSKTGATYNVDVTHAIIAKPDTYNVQLSATVDGVTVVTNVSATVKDEVKIDDDYIISADNFTITVAEVAGLNDGSIKTKANLQAINLKTGTDAEVIVKPHAIKPKEGSYDVTLAIKDKESVFVKIKVTVVENTVENTDYTLSASSFDIHIDDVAAMLADDDILIGNANATAIEKATNNPVDVVVLENDVRPVAGSYQVLFAVDADKDLKLPITVTVYSEGKEYGTHKIIGNNFTMTTAQAENVSDSTIVSLAKAKAYDTVTGETFEIDVDHEIKPTAGEYAVVLKIKGTDEKITVIATVRDNVIIKDDFMITANNFTVTTQNVIDGIDITALSKAKGTNLLTGTDAAINLVEDTVKPIKGTYIVRYEIVGHEAVYTDVTVTVVDHQVDDKGYILTANNFTVKATDVATLLADNNNLIAAANANAMTKLDGKPTNVEVLSHTIVPVKGTYEVVFAVEAENEVKMAVEVKVVENTVTDGTFELSANDIYVTTADVDTLLTDNNNIISAANAHGVNLKTGVATTMKVVSHTIEKTPGTYDVIFGIQEDTNITLPMKVYVTDHSFELDDYRIIANNFEVKASEVEQLTPQQIIDLAGAKGFNKKTGQSETVVISKNEMKKYPGEYNVTFAIENVETVFIIAKATVVDHQIEQGNYRLSANNFTVDKSAVASLDEDKIIELSKAKGTEKLTGNNAEVIVKENEITDKAGNYKVTLAIKADETVTLDIIVTITDKGTETAEYSIHANDFIVQTADVESLTETKMKTRAGATAFDKLLNEPTDVKVKTHSLRPYAGTYDVTFAVVKDPNVEVTVQVTVADSIQEIGDVILLANDFIINKETAETIDNSAITTLGKVRAFNKLTHVEYDLEYEHEIIGKPNTYDVKVIVKDTSVTGKLTVTVKDVVVVADPFILSANNIDIKVSDVNGLTGATLINLANAEGLSMTTGDYVELTVLDHTIQAVPGTYKVKFAVKGSEDVFAEIDVRVFDNTIETPDYKLSASGFSLAVAEIDTLTDDILIAKGKVSAIEKATNQKADVVITKNTIRKTAGEYKVTYAIAADTDVAIEVDVTVYDEGKEDGDFVITASNFIISQSQAKNLSDTQIITLANAKAYNKVTGESQAIKVTHSIYPQAGTYDVFFEIEGTDAKVKVVATVKDNVHVGDLHEISANNFKVNLKDVTSLDENQLITLANATARNLVTGLPANVKVIENKVKASKGTYEVIFAVVGDDTAKVSIQVEVVDNVVTKNDYELSGNNFEVTTAEVAALNENDFITLGNVKAINTITGANETVKVINHNVKARPGNYKVEYAVQADETVTIELTVKVVDKIVETPEYKLSASNFTIKVADVKALNSAAIIDKSDAVAIDKATGQPVEVIVVENNIKAFAGVYEVKLAIKDADTVTTTIKVTVQDNVVENDDFVLSASNFIISTDTAKTITDVEILKRSNATAYNKHTGEALLISVESTIQPKAGEYKVTLSVNGRTRTIPLSMTIDATVKDSVIETDAYLLSANNFTIHQKDVKNLTSQEIIKQSNAYAIDKTTGTETPVIVLTNAVKDAAGTYQVILAVEKDQTVKTAIQVTVIGNDQPLPETGEHTFEMMIIGAEIILLSAAVILYIRQKRHQEQ